MEYLATGLIAGLLVLLPLYYRSNMPQILGALAFGWVLNDITGNEIMLFSRSVIPGVGSNERFALLFFSFLPALAAVYLSKKSTKQPMMVGLYALLAPAIFVIAWRVARASLPYEQSKALVGGQVNDLVIRNQEYALWAAGIVLILSFFLTRKKGSKGLEEKKKGK